MNFLSQLMSSKTVVVNALMVVAGTLAYWQGNEIIAAHPDWVAGLIAIGGFVNVALRLVTVVPVWEK